jgi:hypothetical protein
MGGETDDEQDKFRRAAFRFFEAVQVVVVEMQDRAAFRRKFGDEHTAKRYDHLAILLGAAMAEFEAGTGADPVPDGPQD